MLTELLVQLGNGLVLGSQYALLTIGWTVLLGVARLVNFAHGQLYMIGGMTVWFVTASLGLPYGLAIVVAIVIVALLGALISLILRPLIVTQDTTSLFLGTLGVGTAVAGFTGLLVGDTPRRAVTPLLQTAVPIGRLYITMQDVLYVVVCVLVFVGVWYTLVKTRVGLAVRAVAEDPRTARLYGVRPSTVYIGVFIFSAAAAGLAGATISPLGVILPSVGLQETVIAFMVAIIGGVGNVVGNYVAALGLGVFIAVFGGQVSGAYAMPAAFCILLVLIAAVPRFARAGDPA